MTRPEAPQPQPQQQNPQPREPLPGFGPAVGGGMSILSGLYAGPFQKAMNELFNSQNIRDTVDRIFQLETKLNMKFEVGKFNRYLIDAAALPTEFFMNGGWDAFEADFLKMPEDLRLSVSRELRESFLPPGPLPVLYQTSTNVAPTHDAVIKRFNFNGQDYIGVLYLCPNPTRPR